MEPEELLQKHMAGRRVEDSKLLAASSLVTANRTKELTEASLLLAKTTQVSGELLATTTRTSAELLAKTTRASAELLAKTTQAAAEELSRSSKIAEMRMKWLTIVLIVVGIIQIGIAVIALFTGLRL